MFASSINLSHLTGPVLAQQPYNSCSAHSLYSTVHAMTRQVRALRKISIYQNYADARIMAGTFYSDPGVGSMGDLTNLRAGQEKGLADCAVWSNDPSRMYMLPTAEVYANAGQFKIGSYRQLPSWVSSGTWIENIKRELAAGKPVIAVMRRFYDVDYHVITITGADDNKQGYICKNSFGSDWGDAGYAVMPYSQNTNFYGVYVLDKLGPYDFTYTPERTKIAQLYACFLKRCPELAGLDFWANLYKSGWTTGQIAQALIDSPEGQTLYGSMTAEQFVIAMYAQVMNRVPDQAGFDYFVGLINGGAQRGHIFASTMDYIAAYTGTDPGTLQERYFVENKTNVAMYYAVALQMDGSRVDLARSALVGITADPTTAESAKSALAISLNI